MWSKYCGASTPSRAESIRQPHRTVEVPARVDQDSGQRWLALALEIPAAVG